MNRKIKFRYWNDVTKQMVNDPPMPYKENWTIEQLFSDRGWVWMQFTGLFDRNGKEIYEGDIVRAKGAKQGVYEVRSVSFGLGCEPFNDDYFLDGEDTEVIGNIYENKELLK